MAQLAITSQKNEENNTMKFFRKDLSGRDGHYTLTLEELIEDYLGNEDYEAEDEFGDSLIEWAENSEIGDSWESYNETFTRIE